MRLNDAIVGVILLLLAAAIGWHIRTFPEMPGQKFGPAVFPGLIAAGLAICGVLLAIRGVRSHQPPLRLGEWVTTPALATNFVLVCAVLVFYVIAADTLGFVITGTLMLLALFLKLRVPALRAVIVAVVATLVIHGLFYKVLRVPLPWGVMQGVAW